MNALIIATCLLNNPVKTPKNDEKPRGFSIATKFPKMYALSKRGQIRVYEIIIEVFSDHAVMTTRKKVTIDGKWVEDKYEYWQGVNIGKRNETTFSQQAYSEARSAFNRLKDAGFTETMPDASAKFNTDANGKIKPMLAISLDESKIKFPCLCQPKYDGVRCTISENDGKVDIISRKGKPYKIPHLEKWANENRHLLPLDGELYNHKELSFQDIISAVKKVSPLTDRIKFVAYDRPVPGIPNKERWHKLVQDFECLKDIPVYTSDWVYCDGLEQIKKYHDKCVEDGYEGVIIRNLDGEYEFGFRSNNLIKYKEFNDEEFEITDVVEAAGRDAGTAVFVCKCEGGTFNVKPQGTRELRAEYFKNRKKLIGKFTTVQYQGLSKDLIPRFPSAIAIRDYE